MYLFLMTQSILVFCLIVCVYLLFSKENAIKTEICSVSLFICLANYPWLVFLNGTMTIFVWFLWLFLVVLSAMLWGFNLNNLKEND